MLTIDHTRAIKMMFAVLVLLLMPMAASHAEIPRIINYQGCLVDSLGNPVPDGTYNLIFAIYADSTGGSPLWSNAGYSLPPPVEVENGLFTYYLGSSVPLSPSVFSDSSRWLGITISGEEDIEMTPRIKLTSVPYAYRALYADNATSGGWTQGSGTVYLTNPSDNVGIGVTSPSEPLVIGADLGYFASGNMLVVGDSDPAGWAGITMGENADSRFYMAWDNSQNYVYAGIRSGGVWYSNNLVLKNGRVGIGVASPNQRLVVGKDLGWTEGELIAVGNNEAGLYSGIKFGEDSDNCGTVFWSNDDNQMSFVTKESGVEQGTMIFRGGKLSIGEPSPYAAFTAKKSGTAIIGEDIPGTMGGKGVMGKSSDELGQGVSGMGMGVNGIGVIGQAYGSGGHGVHAEAKSNAKIAIYAEANVTSGIGIEAHGGSGGMAGKFYGNVALYSPDDSHTIMILGEGLDYAEGFHATDHKKAGPGTVMSIDPDHPGKLTICTSAYDTKVAGIVAGANNLGSGVRLGTDGFDLDVALAGRVYCNVEATGDAIQPGDLLTTSSIPGYARKATDYRRAQGAILGKAMQSLAKGEKGLILVLVTLQ